MASQNRFKKDEVINNAIRLYFKYVGNNVIISGVRRLDDEDVKIIGIYSSKDKAEQVIREYIKLTGFKDYP